MIDYIYRPENQAIFTGRENELNQLERHLLEERPAEGQGHWQKGA